MSVLGKHKALIVSVGLVTLLVAGYVWQARTTKNEDLGLCYHAHIEDHTWDTRPYYDEYGEVIPKSTILISTNRDLTFIRHYHPDSELGYCAGNDWGSQKWKADRGSPMYEVREYGSSDRWPEEPLGLSTGILMESLSNPDLHERADCTFSYFRLQRG